MEKRKGRTRQEAKKTEVLKSALTKARATVESFQGEVEKGACKDPTMEAVEAIQDFGRVMAESMNRQFDEQRRREENTVERYKELVEGQMRTHREDAEILAREFEKLRIEKELARGRNTIKLPR